MKPGSVTLRLGDCLEVMRSMPDDCMDSVVTDPPYGLSFMGAQWDHGVPGVEFWAEALRVAKPGATLLAFGGTRTYHRLACAIEDAGWSIWDEIANWHEPRVAEFLASLTDDQRQAFDELSGENGPLSWMHGQGFPKGKAQLKPAWEPIICGTKRGAPRVLNVDACRIGTDSTRRPLGKPLNGGAYGSDRSGRESLQVVGGSDSGRWPANVMLDEVAAEVLDRQSGITRSTGDRIGNKDGGHIYGGGKGLAGAFQAGDPGFGDSGGASRFFYCAKASRSEREAGLREAFSATMGAGIGEREHVASEPRAWVRNHHPTVKPVALMRWLVRLVTPPGGLVLDPFTGSGTTGIAALSEGCSFVGIELESAYLKIAEARIALARGAASMSAPQPELPLQMNA